MPNDAFAARAAEQPALLFPWGLPAQEARDSAVAEAAMWLTGGVALLVWTGLVLLLTSA